MKPIRRLLFYVFVVLLGLIIAVIAMHFHADIPLSELKEKYAPVPSQFIEMDGMPVHYRVEGAADSMVMVLIHGTAASLHTWEDWIPYFEKQYRLISFDLPAFGLTGPHPSQEYSIDYYVDFVHELLRKLEVDSCILAGNSLGGYIAWQFAVKYPNEVSRLILIDAAGYPIKKTPPFAFKIASNPVLSPIMRYITPRSLVAKSLYDVYGNDELVTDQLIDRYFEMQLRAGNRDAFIARVKRIGVDSLVEVSTAIQSIETPTLILWGEADNWIPVANASRFFDDLPNGRLVTYEGVGHVPMEEIPQETARDVLEFLTPSPMAN